MQLIDGKYHAQKLIDSLKEQVSQLTKLHHIPCQLAVVMVGEDPASQIYVNKKQAACAEVGITSKVFQLPSTTTTEQVCGLLDRLSGDHTVHGILVQLPLPPHLHSTRLIQQICPLKDVDGLTAWNQGRLHLNLDGLFPCTPLGCMYLINQHISNLSGITATVIGNSALVGSPMSRLLLAADATVITVHSQSQNIKQHTRVSEVVVVATGHPHLVDHSWIKEHAVVIDVGISRVNGQIVGDVDFSSLADMKGYITPVPGGVGPMTIAMLLANCVRAYRHLHHKTPLPTALESCHL